jgi:hypothetical protein
MAIRAAERGHARRVAQVDPLLGARRIVLVFAKQARDRQIAGGLTGGRRAQPALALAALLPDSLIEALA